jgi:orotate phosphoribosyltransferase
MTGDEVVAELTACGALLEGHFALTSGRHSDRFLQLSVVLQHPDRAARLCEALAALWADEGITVVVGPAVGGIITAYETARALGARALYTERQDGALRLLRRFRLDADDRVLVVDDVVTTGGSLSGTIEAVEGCGAGVVGVGALVHRLSKLAVTFPVPYRPLVAVEAHNFEPAVCPLCRDGVPLVDPDLRTA